MSWLPINGLICAEVLVVQERLATEQTDRRELVSEEPPSGRAPASAVGESREHVCPLPERGLGTFKERQQRDGMLRSRRRCWDLCSVSALTAHRARRRQPWEIWAARGGVVFAGLGGVPAGLRAGGVDRVGQAVSRVVSACVWTARWIRSRVMHGPVGGSGCAGSTGCAADRSARARPAPPVDEPVCEKPGMVGICERPARVAPARPARGHTGMSGRGGLCSE